NSLGCGIVGWVRSKPMYTAAVPRLAEVSPAELDEVAAGFRVIVSHRLVVRREFLHRPRDGAARPGDDLRALVNEIDDSRIGLCEPRTVILMAFVLQVADHAGPVESRAAIETLLRVVQVALRLE